jgi:hypothetical protein
MNVLDSESVHKSITLQLGREILRDKGQYSFRVTILGALLRPTSVWKQLCISLVRMME